MAILKLEFVLYSIIVLLSAPQAVFGRSYAVGQLYGGKLYKNGLQVTSEGERDLEHWRLNYVESDSLVSRRVVDFSLTGLQFLDLYHLPESGAAVRLYSGWGVGQFGRVLQPRLSHLYIALPIGLRLSLKMTKKASLVGFFEYQVKLGNDLVRELFESHFFGVQIKFNFSKTG